MHDESLINFLWLYSYKEDFSEKLPHFRLFFVLQLDKGSSLGLSSQAICFLALSRIPRLYILFQPLFIGAFYGASISFEEAACWRGQSSFTTFREGTCFLPPWVERSSCQALCPLARLSTKFSHLPPRQFSKRITRQNEQRKGSATPICILLSIVDL